MYVENGKISHRQIFRLYVFDLMGIATLLLPEFLAEICGLEGVFAIALGTVFGFAYLFYLGWVMKSMGTDMCTYLRQHKGKLVRTVTLALVMVHAVLTAGFCGKVFSNLMQYSLIQESNYMVVLIVILLISAYAVSGGIECRGRVYEVLFWFVLIPYVVMMLLSLKDFEVAYVNQAMELSLTELLEGSYLVFLFLTPLFFSLFLIREKEKNLEKSMVKTLMLSIVVSFVILLGSFYLLVGNFGETALSKMKYPVITLMSTIQFQGNFVKRMDAFMVAVWFFTLYALLNLHMHYAMEMLKELSTERNRKNLAKWQILVPTALVFAVSMALQYVPGLSVFFVNYYAYVAVPVMIAAPGLLLWRKKG